MSADVFASQVEGQTVIPPIEPSQRTAAKVVGFLYLFQMATAIFGQFLGAGSTNRPWRRHEKPPQISSGGTAISLVYAGDLVTYPPESSC